MALPQRDEQMNVEEFLKLRESDPDHRYEYIDGEIYMMTGGKPGHATIGSNIVRILGNLLESSPCIIYNSDACVQLSEDCYLCPDACVSCDQRDYMSDSFICYPRVVVEVLSPSTKARDRRIKLAKYHACPSIQECLLINAERVEIELSRREKDNLWTLWTLGPADQVELTSLGIRFSVAHVFKKVYFPQDGKNEADR